MTSADITPWPFTVDSGTLRCREGGVITFESGGTEYAVYGEPIRDHYFADPGPIQKTFTLPSGRKSGEPMNSVIAAGQKLC
ncbi:hypothetical protein [Kitasatospora sp. DSM 101779]|uniref:hypothetical protein n=1 Tax=Kitasatospora sp. DSM 101779 TaxID=2853165 RepID=UPI0021D8309E|nr:hypothetical protein [Kitasatospora sp. DSM 101779]MCU7827311.1 hypothetical protein [Kitasatospora sp. DSM 101779]MCU7827424.1 hypothetical protein [Kitasatospora sp. DSM 101779]